MSAVNPQTGAELIRPPSKPIVQGIKKFAGPDIDGFGFVLPAAFIMVALIVYPFCLAVYFSMSDKFIGHESVFIGLENFVYILTELPVDLATHVVDGPLAGVEDQVGLAAQRR